MKTGEKKFKVLRSSNFHVTTGLNFIFVDKQGFVSMCKHWRITHIAQKGPTSRNLLRIKVTPDLHLTCSRNGGNLGLVLKMKNIACISILLTKHVKYTYLYLFKFVLYSIVAFKAK